MYPYMIVALCLCGLMLVLDVGTIAFDTERGKAVEYALMIFILLFHMAVLVVAVVGLSFALARG